MAFLWSIRELKEQARRVEAGDGFPKTQANLTQEHRAYFRSALEEVVWLIEVQQPKQDSLSHVRFADEELIKTQVLQGRRLRLSFRGRIVLSTRWKNETGEGVITRPSVPRICSMTIFICPAGWRTGGPQADLLEINHCRPGRLR